jgi:hypothetical protein
MKMPTVLRHLPARLAAVGAVSALALGIAAPVTAFAGPAGPAMPKICDLACVKSFGDARVADRIASLNDLNSRVSAQLSAKHITSDQAGAIQSDIQSNESGLNALKTKLDGETDVTAARADVKNIYEQFRIYIVVMPRDRGELWLGLEVNVQAKMQDGEAKIETAINGAPAGEQAQLNTLFNDYKTQVGDAQSQIQAAQGLIPQLTPQNANTNRAAYITSITDYRNDLRTAHRDLHQAAKDLHEIARILKSGGSGGASTTTPTASA